jgi:hypothetical protein
LPFKYRIIRAPAPYLFLFFVMFLASSCKTDFGERYTVGNLEIYFTPEVSKKYVEATAEYFRVNNLILDKKHAVQLTSDNKSFILRMVLNPQLTSFPSTQKPALKALEADIRSSVFEGHNFRIEVCDGNFNPLPVQ